MLLSNKKAIITGGSIGMGKAIAEEFVQQGAHLVICARNPSQLQEAEIDLKNIRTQPDQIISSLPCDISNPTEVKQLFLHSQNIMQGLDIVVNNAGIYGPKGSSESVDFGMWSVAVLAWQPCLALTERAPRPSA